MKNLYIIIFTLVFSQSFAQLFFKEGFNYAENSLLTANGWIAHSGGGTNAIKVSTGLTQGVLSIEGNSAILTTSGEDVSRQMTNQVSTGSVYTRFLLNVSAAQDAGDYFFHLGPKDLGTTFRAKVFVKKSGAGFQLGVTKAGNVPVYGATIFDLNTTIMVVMKYTFKAASTTDDEVALFVNPSPASEPTAAGAISTTPVGETDSENIGSIALRQGAAANAPNVKIDEIRIGTAWADIFDTQKPTSNVISVGNMVTQVGVYENIIYGSFYIEYRDGKKVSVTFPPEYFVYYKNKAYFNKFDIPSDEYFFLIGVRGKEYNSTFTPDGRELFAPKNAGIIEGKFDVFVENKNTQSLDIRGEILSNNDLWISSDSYEYSSNLSNFYVFQNYSFSYNYEIINTSKSPIKVSIPKDLVANFGVGEMNLRHQMPGTTNAMIGDVILPVVPENRIYVSLYPKASYNILPSSAIDIAGKSTQQIGDGAVKILNIKINFKNDLFFTSTNKIENITSYPEQIAGVYTYLLTNKSQKKAKITIPQGYSAKIYNNAANTPILLKSPAEISGGIDANSFSRKEVTINENFTNLKIDLYLEGKEFVYQTVSAINVIPAPSQSSIGNYTGKVIHQFDGFEQQIVDVSGDIRPLIVKIITAKAFKDSSIVKVNGRIMSGNVGGNIYIQDETGGIPISNVKLLSEGKMGDSVQISGKIYRFSKQTYIGDVSYVKIGTDSKIAAPKTITSAQLSANEGNLIAVQNINFSDKNFVFLPNTNYTISDGTNASTVRIWETTDIDGLTKPQGNIAITGVVGRFNDGFQIYPRSQADIPTAAALPKTNSNINLDKTLDVAAWNVYWFGNKANGATDEALQQTNVKRVLDSLKADLYVLSEVSNPTAFTDLVAKMIGFKGLCSTAISAGGVADDAQRVCFIYKESVITAISSKPLLKGTTPIANYPDTFDRFWASGRLPFLFVCDANVDGVKRRLNVVGIHARANTASDIPNSERIFQQRKIDVEVLKDSLDKQFKDELVMIAGDFNDDVDENVVAGISTKESSYKKFVDDTENWQAITKTLSDNGYRTYIGEDNVIDHILISNKLKTSYLQNSVRVELPFMYLNNYRNTTSDHIPVMARFQLQALPLATEENVKNFGKIYPNPSNGNIEFDIDDAFKSQSFTYTFSDQVGQVFYSEKGNWSEVKGKMNEALKGKATGIYFLKIADEKKKQVFKVLIEK